MAYVARAAELKAEYGKALNPDNADVSSFLMVKYFRIWIIPLPPPPLPLPLY